VAQTDQGAAAEAPPEQGPVVALAGRRIDAGDEGRFPPANVPLVRARISHLLRARGARALVCSAACGADLLALEAAEGLGLRRRVVLPFAPERFRESSVIDRPGDWGPSYDRTIEAVTRAGDLVVLVGAGEGGVAYAAANERILDEALRLASVGAAPQGTIPPEIGFAVIVWDGRSRGDDDVTERFAASARRRGMVVEEVLTS
jgi:hypothetical protein